MANEKMTLREFYTAVAGVEGIADNLKDFAEGEIAKLDKRNADRKGKPSKTAQVNAPIKDAIVEFVKTNPNATAEVIGGGVGQTTAKVSALATQLVKDGVLAATEVKKANGKGKVKAYTAL